MSQRAPSQLYEAILDEIGTVIVGNETVIERLTVAALSNGHVLLEGVPGVAKTTMARLFATVAGLEYRRIQLLPDLLPSDITGSTVYREATGRFELKKGPIFANVVVADEINRATPKTQSAFLEAMAEASVTIDQDTVALPEPFLVIATQNPLETEGTYELPIAQRDRFQLKLVVDIPDREDEARLLNRFNERPDLGPDDVSPVTSPEELLSARRAVAETYVDEKIADYVLDVVAALRTHEAVEFGASPRATLAFLNAGKARAAIKGRNFVIPEDIKALAGSVLRHRTILTTDAELGGRTVDEVVSDVLESAKPPGSELDAPTAADGDGFDQPDDSQL